MDFFTAQVATFCTLVYRNCKSDDNLSCGKALNPSFLAQIVFSIAWLHQGVLFSLFFATLSGFWQQLSAADEIIAYLNSTHSFSMSANASGSCLNLDYILDAKLLSLPKHPILSGTSQKTCYISCLAKVLKVAMSMLLDGDQLAIQQLAPLER